MVSSERRQVDEHVNKIIELKNKVLRILFMDQEILICDLITKIN
uniref:Uncharacterized protein n=1 Tax=Aegilops tauschii subsp. strangulata TaxID=200361 RepID=A0A453RJR8_AEGTS